MEVDPGPCHCKATRIWSNEVSQVPRAIEDRFVMNKYNAMYFSSYEKGKLHRILKIETFRGGKL